MRCRQRPGRGALALLLGVLALNIAHPAAARNATQRDAFTRAEAALERADAPAYALSRAALDGYPLLPYLEYRRLGTQLDNVPRAKLEAFLATYPDTPLAQRLRRRWLTTEAARGNWEAVLDLYQATDSTEARCHWLHALIRTGSQARTLDGLPELWNVSRSQPAACDPVFAAWRAAGKLGPDVVWGRTRLAIAADRRSLVAHLERFLNPELQKVTRSWRGLREGRITFADALDAGGDREALEFAMAEALARAARKDPARAVEAWEAIADTSGFEAPARARITGAIGTAFARRHRAAAARWLYRPELAGADGAVRDWQATDALRRGDWDRVVEVLDAAPTEARWSYWRGRALDATGRPRAAAALYRKVAEQRGYYGFLAADRLDSPYRLGDRAIETDPAEIEALARTPSAVRAAEFLALGRSVDARREWRWLTRNMTEPELLVAARLAHAWQWHSVAIFTVARTAHRDDLELRFPLAYREPVLTTARDTGLDPAWILAVARQESAFMADVQSSAGALGLMQLMPATGREMARRLKRGRADRWRLLDPQFNLDLGGAYLDRLHRRYTGNRALALAAYNAGPGRVKRWRPRGRALDGDVWVESIPFPETQEYVRRVLTYTAIYESRFGLDPVRLGARLVSVAPR